MTTTVCARPSIPNIIDINGNLFEITIYEDGKALNFSADEWTRIRQAFTESLQHVNEAREDRVDFSMTNKIVLHLDTRAVQIWNRGEQVYNNPSIFNRISYAATNSLIAIVEQRSNDDSDKEPKKAPRYKPFESNSVKPQVDNDDDDERFIAMAVTDRDEAFALDFEGNFGDEVHSESLGYYLNQYSQDNVQVQILFEGDDTQYLVEQRNLIEWADSNRRHDFDQWLEALNTLDTNRIYIPFRSPGHYQMIIVDKQREQIIGYNSKGNFNANEAHQRVTQKLQTIFTGYEIIGDEAFLGNPHQGDNDNHCGIYIVHFIHQMEEFGQSAHQIFQNPVTEIQSTRDSCAQEIRLL